MILLSCALVTFSMLMGAGANDALLHFFGPVIMFSLETYNIVLLIFKVCGAVTLASFPGVMINLMVRSYDERQTVKEGQQVILASITFCLLLFVTPAVLMIVQQRYDALGILAGVIILGIITGRYGKKSPMPSFWV